MNPNKPSTSRTNWKSDINHSDLEDFIDPANQEEIEEDIHTIMKIIAVAKKSRTEAYNFNPAKLKKEKRIKKAKKEIQNLKAQSSAISRENNLLKKEIRHLEKNQKEETPYAPKSKLFKRPTVQQRENVTNFLNSIENLQDTSSLIKGLKLFNQQAEEEIKKLNKEIESDKYNYDTP
ncbi:hypothetical protein SteCoe_30540 [Stentor coeruleus]|uniref:Uncharacterized protein n=1 Tax=Stentor coeruleus TaxID=5963 RepID=A0A1R2B3W4_9CILI|nr:hypothetical protein SteCoe_30540 [Stentor coeruleus]